jgi:glucose/mannose-6-phosphate isomerase
MQHILDDANIVAQRDPQGALGFAVQQPSQLTHDFGIAGQKPFSRPVKNIVFAGMGGSSLTAELAKTWPEISVPFVVSKTYTLPAFVNEDTLVIAASASGNTEETLESLTHAEERGAMIAVIAHGGRLVERAKAAGHLLAQLPDVPQPRYGVFYDYRALVEVLVAAGVSSVDNIAALESLVGPLEKAVTNWVQSVPAEQNYAKQIADQMVGKTPIIYGGPLTYPAAYKWKIDVNENAKNTAWCNALPEFNHNEFIGWSSHPVEKPFAVVDLVSSFEHPRVLKRFELIDRMLSGLRPKAINIQLEGDSIVEQLLYAVLLGDFATLYLGLLNGVNPTPVDLVEKFKKELGPYDPPATADV